MAPKPATVFVIDCGMSEKALIDKAKQFVSKKLHEKLLAGRKTDFVALMLSSTLETKNQLATAEEGQYEHVTIFSGIQLPSADSLRQFNATVDSLLSDYSAADAAAHRGDSIDAIVVAADMLMTYCGTRKYEKMVYLFTDSSCPADPSGIEQIAETLESNQIQLTLIGMDFAGEQEEDGEERADEDAVVNDLTSAPSQDLLKWLARKRLERTKSEWYTWEEAEQSMQQFHKKPVASVALYKGPLRFSDMLTIPVVVVARTAEFKLPSLTASAALQTSQFGRVLQPLTRKTDYVPAGEDASAGDSKQSQRFKVGVAGNSLRSQIQQQSQSQSSSQQKQQQKTGLQHSISGPDEKAIAAEDLAKVFHYGSSAVIVGPLDLEEMQWRHHKDMWFIGFVPAADLPRQYFLSNTLAVHPPPDDHRACKIFLAFCQAMAETENVALVGMVQRENGNPKIGVLVPAIKAERYQFCHFVHLPYSDDVRDYSFPKLPLKESSFGAPNQELNGPSAQQLAAVENLIATMQLKIGSDGEDESLAFKPSRLYNPSYQRLSQCVLHRFLHPNDRSLPPLDPRIAAEIFPPADLVKQPACEQIIARLKSAFPLSRVLPPEKRRKRFRQDRLDAPTTKPISLDEILSFGSATSAPTDQTSIPSSHQPESQTTPLVKKTVAVAETAAQTRWSQLSSQSPYAKNEKLLDFVRLLDEPGDNVSEAVTQFALDIKHMTLTADPELLVYCVQVLRKVCANEDEAPTFNQLMSDLNLLSRMQMIPAASWQLLKHRAVLPISIQEAPGGMTVDQQSSFYQ